MTVIIHDSRVPAGYVEAIKAAVPQAFPLSFDMSGIGRPYDSIVCHPDVYFCPLRKAVVHSPDVPEHYTEVFAAAGIRVVMGEKPAGAEYPGTAGYNAAAVGDVFMHNLNLTDRKLLAEAERCGYKLVHVKQGYTRCAVVTAGKNAILTADDGIAKEAEKNGLEALVVADADIALPGETLGFLGGASGNLPGGTVLFLGDIMLHPDAREILAFLEKHHTGCLSLKGLRLYDAGSLIIPGWEI